MGGMVQVRRSAVAGAGAGRVRMAIRVAPAPTPAGWPTSDTWTARTWRMPPPDQLPTPVISPLRKAGRPTWNEDYTVTAFRAVRLPPTGPGPMSRRKAVCSGAISAWVLLRNALAASGRGYTGAEASGTRQEGWHGRRCVTADPARTSRRR